MIFDGKNGGTVELTGTGLVLRHKGVLSALSQGIKGEKRIPFASITSVQFKDAGLTTGYIQFGVLGGKESRGGVWDAARDENTILFTKEASAEFKRLRDLVEQRLGAHKTAAGAAAAPAISVSEELTRLADLRDRGVLTDEEFLEQKKRLLGQAQGAGAPAAGSADPLPGVRPLPAVAPPFPPPRPPADKSVETGKMVGWGCLGLLVLLLVIGVIGSAGNKTAATSNSSEADNLAIADLNAAAPEAAKVETPSPWSYSEDEDKVRGGTTYYASTTSTNSIAQDFPYDSDTTMRMTVRKSPAYGTDVILTISSGQMMCPSYDGCSGTVRFDNGPAQRISFSGPEDNSSETIFVDGAKSFIAKLKKAKHVTIEKTLYQAGNPQFEFNVEGLKWTH